MWTPKTRAEHDRDDLRYPSDVTDAEWQILAPLLPAPAKTGRHRSWPMREVMNAIFFVLRGGCAWRMLPEHFPPHQTAYRWFTRFRDDGTWEILNHHLVMLDRERVGREASPSAAVIDSQSVKTTEAGGPRGYDAGKKINGRKRQVMVDTDGRGVMLQVHAASIQDRDGAIPLLREVSPAAAVHRARLRRQRLCRRTRGEGHQDHRRDRTQAGRPDRLCRPSPALGGRTPLRLARAKPPSGEGLRGNRRISNGLPLCRLRHAAHSTPRSFALRFKSNSETLPFPARPPQPS